MASLTYCRALTVPGDFGKYAVLRDAYLFAAPVVCDVPSMRGEGFCHIFANRRVLSIPNITAFNEDMYEDEAKPRVMWRVTCVRRQVWKSSEIRTDDSPIGR